MRLSIIVVFYIFIPCFLLGQDISKEQMDKYIFKIYSKECKFSATGFLLKGKKGIYTSLHCVVGCTKNIYAQSVEETYDSLKIIQIDIKHDIAVLSCNKLESNSEGLDADYSEISGDREVRIWPYSFGVEVIMDNVSYIRKANPLVRLSAIAQTISSNEVFRKLFNRNSPSLGINVINLQGGLKHGGSGSPITYKGKVIGIGAGEIPQTETSDFAFGIPLNEIQVLPPTRIMKDTLNSLANMSTTGLFVYNNDLDTLHKTSIEISEKTSTEIAEVKFRIKQINDAISKSSGKQIMEMESDSGILGSVIDDYITHTELLTVALKLGGITTFPPAKDNDQVVLIGYSGYSSRHLPYQRGYKNPQYMNMDLYDLIVDINKNTQQFNDQDLKGCKYLIDDLEKVSDYYYVNITKDWFQRMQANPPYDKTFSPAYSIKDIKVTDYDENVQMILEWVETVNGRWANLMKNKVISSLINQ